jgi:hypothetical protein
MTVESIVGIIVKELRQIIREEVQAANRKEPEPELSDRMSRRQAAKFMEVSYQTMYNYRKAGTIKEHGTKGKKFFLRKELIEVIKNKS